MVFEAQCPRGPGPGSGSYGDLRSLAPHYANRSARLHDSAPACSCLHLATMGSGPWVPIYLLSGPRQLCQTRTWGHICGLGGLGRLTGWFQPFQNQRGPSALLLCACRLSLSSTLWCLSLHLCHLWSSFQGPLHPLILTSPQTGNKAGVILSRSQMTATTLHNTETRPKQLAQN